MRAKTVSIAQENAYQAGREAAQELLIEMAHPDLVMVFSTYRHAPEQVLEGLWSCLPRSARMIGCSSFAEIGAEEGLAGSVTLMGIEFGVVEWQIFKLDDVGGSSDDAGAQLAGMIQPFDPRLVVILPDGMRANSVKLVRAMQEVLGQECPIIGGVSSEGLEFVRTFELFDREVIDGGVVALALRGPIRVATCARAGFQPVGVLRTCTRVEGGKLVLELDGKSALDIYKDFLGPGVAERPNIGTEFPLAVVNDAAGDYMSSDERSQVIRVVRMLDEERGALLCGGDIDEGAKVRLTRATKEDLIAAARSATEQVTTAMPNAKIAFLFNCAGRRLVLGGRHQDEIAATFSLLGEDVARIGFYTYGEIAPVAGSNMYHDETFTLALIGLEAEAAEPA